MRFGRQYHQYRIPEWDSSYIDYYALKRRIKLVRDAVVRTTQVDLSGFYKALDSEVLMVDAFYSRQSNFLSARTIVFRLVRDGHRGPNILAMCVSLSADVRKLRWYAKVNSDAVRFLARKADRLVPFNKNRSLQLDLGEHQFMTQRDILPILEQSDSAIRILTSIPDSSPSRTIQPETPNDALSHVINHDSHVELERLLASCQYNASIVQEHLHQSALKAARKCFKVLLNHLGTNLDDRKWGTGFNILHTIVLSSWTKVRLLSSRGDRERYSDFWDRAKHQPVIDVTMLQFSLDCLTDHQRSTTLHTDYRGRLPLHYAAEAGLLEMCEVLVNGVNKLEPLPSEEDHQNTSKRRFIADSEGNTPLHLSVLNDHAEVTRFFLHRPYLWRQSIDTPIDPGDFLAQLLHIALKRGSTETMQVLLEDAPSDKLNLNYCPTSGETALIMGSRYGSCKFNDILIQSPSFPMLDINKAEHSYGWTPLIVACVMEHLEVVEKLLKLGADESCRDAFGWTALDHAAFRGYWKIAKLLKSDTKSGSTRLLKAPLPVTNALPPCSSGCTRIFVNIGPLNTRQSHGAVDLSPYLPEVPYSPYPDVGFYVEVSGIDCKGPTRHISLPCLDDSTNYPLVFETSAPQTAKLAIKLYAGEHNPAERPQRCMGMAVALLQELGDTLGPGRESFFRDHKLPIIDNTHGKFLGTVTINFLLVKPRPDPRPTRSAINKKAWFGNGKARLIGHRGLGMNSPALKRLQIGENTIQSFKSTIDLGVSYIECDVQLTRDHVPVIYHDFLMSESGADIAPHNLSLDQFMSISDSQLPSLVLKGRYGLFKGNGTGEQADQLPITARKRAQSFDVAEDCRIRGLLDRIQHTYEYKLKGFKGNMRGTHIHGPFTTLHELLTTLPEDVALDIELKYPMLWEAEDWKMDLYGVELNLYTDTILDEVYKHGGNRPILFTSFSPELCILAAHKQNTYPVMFLNESNLFPTGDVRASNLQEAIHFARHWALPGVVMSAEPFVASPKLVRFVQDAGLMCTSFGMPNNDPENARIQVEAGIDAIIVDSVALISKSFKESVDSAAVTEN